MTAVTARAPATTGNVAVGFDVLGFATDVLWDEVTVRLGEPGVRINRLSNPELPRAADANTAGVALQAMLGALELDVGFDVEIEKGIPLGSGLGGSAASAVGAVVAANELLDEPCTIDELFDFALAGEAISSGSVHPDNVAPCLYGGLTLTTPRGVRVLPTPQRLSVALVHPHIAIATRDAREVLPDHVPLSLATEQMAHLGGFIDACYRNDERAAGYHCRDLLAQPHRKSLLPGFDQAEMAARDAGALAFSLSGSGPTVFALATDAGTATTVAKRIAQAFESVGLQCTPMTSTFGAGGAEVA